MIILFGSFYLMKPSVEQLKKEKAQQQIDSLKRVGKSTPVTAASKTDTAKTNTPVDSALLKGAFGAATVGTEKFITLENKDLRLKIATRGGRIYSAELKDYQSYGKQPLVLFNGDQNHFGISFVTDNKNFNTNNLYFTPSGGDVSVVGNDSSSVTMRLSYSPTQYIDYIYTLAGTGYKVGFTIKPTGMDNVIANNNVINIYWAAGLLNQEKDVEQERRYSNVYYKDINNDVDDLSATKPDDSTTIADKKIQWVSFKAHFFSSVLLAQDGFSKSSFAENTDTSNHAEVKQLHAGMQLTRNSAGVYPMSF